MLIVGCAVVLLASAVQGVMGSGSALIMVPVLSLFLAPREVVPITLLLGTVMNLSILVQARKGLDLRMVLPLFASAVVGIPLGTIMLLVLPADVLRVVIGAVIIFFSLALLSGVSMKVRRERAASVPIGLISGVLNGSITMSGPPVILFFQNLGMPKGRFRANIVAFFLLSNLVTILFHAAGGVLTAESSMPVVLFLPVMGVGLAIGMALAGRVPERPFRTAVLSMVALAGVASVVTGAFGLI